MRRIFLDPYSGRLRESWLFISFLAAVFAVIAAVIFASVWTIAAFDAPYQSRQCSRYADNTGREVQFRQFSHWSYDCFVRLEDGTWVTKDQIRGVNQ